MLDKVYAFFAKVSKQKGSKRWKNEEIKDNGRLEEENKDQKGKKNGNQDYDEQTWKWKKEQIKEELKTEYTELFERSTSSKMWFL